MQAAELDLEAIATRYLRDVQDACEALKWKEQGAKELYERIRLAVQQAEQRLSDPEQANPAGD